MIKVLLTKDELDRLMEVLGNDMVRYGDDDNTNCKGYKQLDKIYDKLVKGLNKNGVYYLWQLIDRNEGVTEDNIKPEWRLKK